MIFRLTLLSLLLLYVLSTTSKNQLTNEAYVQEIREYLNAQNFNENRAEITQTTDESPITLDDVIIAPIPETVQPRQTRFNADTIANEIEVANRCSGNSVHAVGKVEVAGKLQTKFFNAEELHLNRLTLKSLYNPHRPIILRGNLKLASVKTTQPVDTASFLVKGVKQWSLLSHDIFNEKEKVEGWSFMEIGSCEGSQVEQKFLGGHCLLNTEVKKEFGPIPSHEKLRITGTVHLFDKWEGEKIFLEMDGTETIWSKTGAVNNKFETMNRCGNPNYGDSLMDMKIDKIIDHKDSSLALRFYTNMVEKDACNASYGIADLAIYYQ